ncbi:MAG TPA: efflux RND transporter permease subunit [Thermoguttaceae bacterium]|nr:efflux RND transporter permease subunit [Thermoguttaceae bacterium]
MDPIRFAIQNPVKVAVGVILVLLFGVIALTAIPIQLTPDVDRPVVTVRTEWPGRSPEEIEESILIEQEEKLKTLQGLYKMTSTAELGRANITLEFRVGFNVSRALQEVANRLDEVPSYPEDVDRPVIRASDTASDDAIAYCLVEAEDPDFEVARFYDYADRYLKPALERIPGVAEIGIYGGREHQAQVQFDPVASAQRGISVEELRSALQSDNVNESAGDLANGRQDVRFRVIGQFDSLDPLRQTIVKYDADGVPIRVEDVAEVKLVLEKKVHFDQCKGRTSMTIFIKRETGTNVVEIMKQVRREIDDLNAPGGVLPSFKNDRYGVRLRLVVDDTYYIHRAVGLVRENLLVGGSLAVLVLLLFLRSPRPTLIIAVAIPISVIGTFVVMALTGRNLNVISLAGLAFAVGMVVDNAIVVLENIDRHLAMGEQPSVAAYRGAKEVWGAILASTLTTVAVFAPVLTIKEESGQLFYDIALAICAAVTLSLLVSISVIPTAGAKFLRDRRPARGPIMRAVHSLFGLAALLSWGTDAFARLIHLMTFPSLAGVWLRAVVITVITVVAVGLSWMLMLPASYLPDGNKNFTFGMMFNPPGYSLEQNTSVAERLEESVRPYWEAKDSEEATVIAPLVDVQTGKPIANVPALEEFFFVVSRGRVFMITTSKDPENVRPVKAILTRAMKQIPGSYGYASQRSIFGRNAGGSNSVEVEVVGNDMQRLKTSAAYLQKKLWDEFSNFAVRSDPMTFNEAGPERRIVIDQVRAKELGLSVHSLALAARAMVDGAIVGDFTFEGDNIDLVIIRDPTIELTPDLVADLPLAITEENGRNTILPLGELVDFVEADASQSIRRVEQRRAVTFTVNPPPEMALEEAQARIEELVAESRHEGGMASDVQVNMSGNADKLTQTRTALLGRWDGWSFDSLTSVGLSRFFLALLITYLLMAALFESFLYPLVIMFSVPLATVGGFAGLRLVRLLDPTQQLDTLTMLGFIILIGVVVNNAILIVHQALNFMRGIGEGEEHVFQPLPPREAIRQSVKTRIRPIFMTTATSVCGMLPLVLAPGAGSELYRGLGAVVVGGLICSTLFTLVVVPLLFSLVVDARMFLVRALYGEQEEAPFEAQPSTEDAEQPAEALDPISTA